MIPRRRFLTLLEQAHTYQVQRCIYHNTPPNMTPFSLYTDHQCDKVGFPRTTTNILAGHGDEVWNLEWSHDGTLLASASRDKTAIIWRVKVRSPFCSPWSRRKAQDIPFFLPLYRRTGNGRSSRLYETIRILWDVWHGLQTMSYCSRVQRTTSRYGSSRYAEFCLHHFACNLRSFLSDGSVPPHAGRTHRDGYCTCMATRR